MAEPGYVLLDGTGDFASTPDASNLNPISEVDIRIAVAPNDWTPAAEQVLVAKSDGGASSYRMALTTAGAIRSHIGQGASGSAQTSGTIPGVADGQPMLLRSTLDADDGSGNRRWRWYWRVFNAGSFTVDLNSDSGWTEIGAGSTLSGTQFMGNDAGTLTAGADPGGSDALAGKVYGVVVKSPIAGSVIANPNFSGHQPSDTSFIDTSPLFSTFGGVDLDGSDDLVDSPDHADFDVTDLDARAAVSADDFSPASTKTFVSKWNTSGNQRSFSFDINSSGNLVMRWSADGSAELTATSTTNVQNATNRAFDGQMIAVRVTLDIDNGASGRDIKFFLKTLDQQQPILAQIESNSGWLQVGSTVTQAGVTSIFAGTALPAVGAQSTPLFRFAGMIYAAVVKNGIDGTTIANPDFTGHMGSDPSETDGTGKVWTLRNGAAFVADSTQTGKTWTLSGNAVFVADVADPYVQSPQALPLPPPRDFRLGCGVHRVYIRERGGGDILGEIDYTSLSYSRRLDDMSDGTVTIGADGLSNEACCRALAGVQSWKHELEIYRDDDPVPAWVGPIVEIAWGRSQVSLQARDLFAWFERRVLPFGREFVLTDLGTIFQQYVNDALSGDTSPNINVEVSPVGILGDRFNDPTEFRRAADELRELARSGVDFTMIGRTMQVGGEEVPTSSVGILIDEYFTDVTLTEKGLETATEVIVVGAQDPDIGVPIFGSAGGVELDLGLIQAVHSESSILDENSAAFAAQGRLLMLNPPPSYVEGTLSQDAPIGFSDLIPGAHADLRLRLACKDVDDDFRLQGVGVNASAESGQETVQLTFIPLGAVQVGS